MFLSMMPEDRAREEGEVVEVKRPQPTTKVPSEEECLAALLTSGKLSCNEMAKLLAGLIGHFGMPEQPKK